PRPKPITLDQAAGEPVVTEQALRLPWDRPALRAPLGTRDDPIRQWQGVWGLDLAASGGHVALIGGPQSGKTTLLRTLVTALALTHTPDQVTVYGLDLVGVGLQSLGGLPHVGGVAVRTYAERIRLTSE